MRHTLALGRNWMLRALLWLCPLVFLVGMRATAQTASINVMFDPASTRINWTLGAVLHTVHGSFRLKSGFVHLDLKTGEMTGLLVVDATSGESGDTARDRRMHQSILESSKYPEITFRPVRLNGTLDPNHAQKLTIDGVLNLHGHDHPTQVTVNLRPSPSGMSVAANFDVPYVQWGMRDPSTFVLRVSKDVSITIDAAVKIQP